MRQPNYTMERPRPSKNTVNASIMVACSIACRYSRRLPTVKELQEQFGMSRATAYRWIHALRESQGEVM